MERLTKKEPQGNFETLMNYAYAKDGCAHLRYAGGEYGVPLHEYTAGQCKERGCDENSESVYEEGLIDCPDCIVAIMYYLGCQAAENNARLMKFEDAKEHVDTFSKRCR